MNSLENRPQKASERTHTPLCASVPFRGVVGIRGLVPAGEPHFNCLAYGAVAFFLWPLCVCLLFCSKQKQQLVVRFDWISPNGWTRIPMSTRPRNPRVWDSKISPLRFRALPQPRPEATDLMACRKCVQIGSGSCEMSSCWEHFAFLLVVV